MGQPRIAKKAPFAVEVEQGVTYFWCSCGRSKTQPYCDGSHAETEFVPKSFTAKESGTVYLCGCKQSCNSPYCDGSHNEL